MDGTVSERSEEGEKREKMKVAGQADGGEHAIESAACVREKERDEDEDGAERREACYKRAIVSFTIKTDSMSEREVT